VAYAPDVPLHRFRQLPATLPARALYALTLVLELPVIFTRWLLTFLAASLLLLALHHSNAGALSISYIAFIPTAWSLLALVTPFGGGWWRRQRLGGREPSERERSAYRDALALLRSCARVPVREPGSWFVLDTPHPEAAVCGDTLMLSRGLLESDGLAAVLGHELGHLASGDGKLAAALERLLIQLRDERGKEQPSEPHGERRERTVVLADDRVLLTVTLMGAMLWMLRKVARFARGGLGLRLTSPLWGSHWREREYLADRYAAHLRQGDDLADFLEEHALIHDHPRPFVWLTEHDHPPTELRIDRLRNASRLQAA